MKGISKKIEQSSSLRKAIWISLIITLAGVSSFLLYSKATPALAACSPTTSYGTDTVSLKNVPTTGTYTAWMRLLSPDGTNNQVMMSIDGGPCFTMGGSMPANTWTWINTSAGTSNPVTVSLNAGTHSIVFTGNQTGVELDEAQFLTDPTCIPVGITNNCTTNQATPPTVSITAPASGATVSGNVTLSAAASDSVGVTQVQFKVDNVNVGAADTVSPYTTVWNSTGIADGTHTITATATNTAGLTATDTETVTVANHICSANPNAPSNVHDTDTAPLPANKVDLGWTAGSAATNCVLAGYNIFRNGSTTPLNPTPVNANAYSDLTVAASTTYTYQVATVDTNGHVSTKVPVTPLSVTTGANCTAGSGAPTTPSGLQETANTYTTLTFTWNASSVNNGCTLSGYHIYRNGSPTPIATVGLTTTFTDTGLTSGTSYNYSVKAFDSGGNVSSDSTVVAMITKVDDVAPTMPTGLTGTAPDAGSVNLNWVGSTDLPNPGGVGLAGYYIYRNDSTTPTYTVNGSATTFTDSSVNASTTYKYAVAAFDRNNNISSETADITVTTPAPTCSGNPTVPGSLHSTGATLNTISLAWTASTPATGCTLRGYQVFRDHTFLTNVLSGTTFTDTNLAPNTTYIYSLVAVDTSSNKSATTPDFTTNTLADTTPPSAPTNFVVSAPNPAQVSMGWTASSDNVAVTGYNIYRNNALLKTVGVVTSYIDSTVSPNTTYTYLLEALDAAGNKSSPKTPSTPATITTPPATDTQKPTTPTGLAAGVVSSNSVDLTWNASTDNVAVAGYNVFRDNVKVNSSLIGSTSFTDNGLTANTTYTYTVVAVDTSNNVSDPSSPLPVTTQSGGAVPGDINGDGRVDTLDFTILIIHDNPSTTVPQGTNGDLFPVPTGDGKVDTRDLTVFLIDWGIFTMLTTNSKGLGTKQ